MAELGRAQPERDARAISAVVLTLTDQSLLDDRAPSSAEREHTVSFCLGGVGIVAP